MFTLLQKGVAWVTMYFDDSSVRSIKTTLNNEILASFGVKPKAGYFYDLTYGEFVPFREDATSIEVTTERPSFDDEVINFVNRFI